MSWKYPVGFKYIDPSGDLECKVLRRRINDDDMPFYIVEKCHPNNKFFEENVMENILDDEVHRGLPFVDDYTTAAEEADFDLDFDSLIPKKRGPKPKPKFVKFEPEVRQPVHPRVMVEPVIKKISKRPVIAASGRIELNEEQKRRLAEWKANRK